MMKLHNFVNDSVDFLLSEDFNVAFWLTYLGLGTFGLCCMAFFFLPPVFFVGVALVLTPLVVYGALWAAVGVLKVVDLIFGPSKAEVETHLRLKEALEGKAPKVEYFDGNEFEDSRDMAVVADEPGVSFKESYGQPAKHLVPGYKPQFVFNEGAAAEANPLREQAFDESESDASVATI